MIGEYLNDIEQLLFHQIKNNSSLCVTNNIQHTFPLSIIICECILKTGKALFIGIEIKELCIET